MINFACPRCKAQYHYEDDMAGKKIRCLGPKCGQKLLVPGLAPPASANAPPAGRRPAAGKAPPAASGKNGTMGDRQRLFRKKWGDLCLRVNGLCEAPAPTVGDMQRELRTIANELRRLTELIDAEFGSST